MTQNFHEQTKYAYPSLFPIVIFLNTFMKSNRNLLYICLFLFFTLSLSTILSAQDSNSCPCENCPDLIEDNTGFREYRLNVFNVKNNDLSGSTQCVSKVGIKFKHQYVGDLIVELVSPEGDVVQLMGDVSFAAGSRGQTDNRVFDIAFVGNGEPAMPDNGYENRWNNDQEWTGIGTLNGTYLPFKGDLSDFNKGRVNGTWTLRVGDFAIDRSDEGELIDFYVEFCDPVGLVCDPCLDPEDTPDCIFRVDAGETTVVPGDFFCLPIYAENVAFLKTMVFPISWDPNVLEYIGVDSFEIEFLEESDFGLLGIDNGSLLLSYIHDTDTLGLVVADSTPIFQVCFNAIGAVGDSSIITIPVAPIAIDVDGMTRLEETIEGTVKITVDSTADCVQAIQLCGKDPISVAKSRGPGFEENEAIVTCSSDGLEHQSKWYRFDVLENGNLDILLKPKGAASYGFSLYKGGCPTSVDSEAIGCATGLENRGTGFADDPLNDFGEADISGNSFLPSLAVIAGETYFILVDNFSDNGVGFDLSFGGSAIIGDETLRSIIGDPATLNCTNSVITLDATNSTSGSQYDPIWTTDEGNIDFSTEFFQPTINKGGNFYLAITDRVTGCVSKDSVFVATDMVNPFAVANNGGVIDCFEPTRILNNLGSSTGAKFDIQWENTTTDIPDLPSSEAITVDKGGAYELKITNTENGCIATDIILITENFTAPQLTTADNFISCDQPLANLLATSTTTPVQFEWSGGDLDTPLPEAEITVNDTGIFIMKVTAMNGCTTIDSVEVREERIYPDVEAGDSITLNCDFPIIALDGNGSSTGSEFVYSWSTPDGQFVTATDTNSLSPEIEAGGIYLLTVKNTMNGCDDRDFVVVDTSFTDPTISIVADTLLTCNEPILTLDASESDSGAIYDFDWFINEGNILRDEVTYQPKINQSGNYIFTIRNVENGCATSQLVTIEADQVAPIANAGSTQTLNCSQRVVILDGAQSSQGEAFSYNWSTQDGHFIGENNTIITNVDSAGIYQLSVQNQTNGCSTDTTVTILKDFVVPDLRIPTDSTLTCIIPSISLTASSTTENTNFLWQFPDGNRVPTNQIAAINAGKYIATVTAANGCVKVDSLMLEAEQVLPSIVIEDAETITCITNEITIIGAGSEQGNNLEFIWTTEEGLLIDENQANTINPVVEEPGEYFLEITNTTTGCIAKDSINVPSSVVNPIVSLANEPSVFSCANTRVEVLATSDVSDAIYEWKLASETIIDSAQLVATAPGTYSVIVINPANSCSSLVSVEIEADTLKPLAEAGPTKELNCTIGTVVLDASSSVQGPEFSYLWRTIGIEEVSDSIRIEVFTPGLYDLIVVDQSNGCRSIDTVRVTVSRDNPIADAGLDTIYCSGVEADILDFSLGGNATSIGDNFTYEWLDEADIILGDSMDQQVKVAGVYFLEVTNADNNCVNVDSVTVFERARPIVSLTSTGGINCATNEIRYLAESDIFTSVITWFGEMVIDSANLVVTDALLGESFIAIAEDTITGCRGESTTVRVEADRLPPLLTAGDDTQVNCADTLRLAGQLLSANIAVTTNWQTEDGNIVTGRDELTPIVDAAGQYVLTIQNISNFCESTDTVIVSTDQMQPIVTLGEDQILTCFNPVLTIVPNDLSEGANFYYNWKDESNKLISTEKELVTEFPGTYQLLVIDSSNLCKNADVLVVIDSLNPPEIEISTPDLITCLNNEVALNTVLNIDNATFQWVILSDTGNIIGAQNEKDLIVDSAGIYQIEVTNNFSGCSGEKNITVQDIRNEIRIEAGADKTITCNNDTTVLAAGTIFLPTNNLQLEWTANISNFSNIDTALLFTIKESGTYFLKVVDTLSFCEATDSFFVDKDITPVDFNIGLGDTLNCVKETVILGDINEVNSPYIYQWTTRSGNITAGANQSAVMVNQPGMYQLDIESTLNGCTFTDSLNVVVDRLMPSIDVGQPKELTCLENEVIIGGVTTDIGISFAHEWTTENGKITGGATTPFATVNEAGVYQLLVRNTNNQCEHTETIEITTDQVYPVIDLPNNLSFACTDDFIAIEPRVAIELTDLTIAWQTENGVLASETNSFVADVAAPGSYIIVIEDVRNNCITTDTVLVADNRELPEIVEIADQTLGCDEQPIMLSAAGSASGNSIEYKWIDETGLTVSNNIILTTVIAGLYTFEITNQANSCVSRETVQISENTNPPVSAAINLADPACEGINNGFIEITDIVGGTAPFNYRLNNFESNEIPLFSDLAPNSYTLTIVDKLACAWDTTLILNQPLPIEIGIIAENQDLVTGQTGTFTLTSSIPSTDLAEIIWSPSDLINCSNCEEINTAFANNTTLTVQVIDINGCEGMATLAVEVELATVPNGITPNGDGKNDFFIIPIIEQQPAAFPNSELTIFNRWGDIIYEVTPYNNDWNGNNNTGSPIPEGTYYYVLRLDTREGEIIKGDVTILRN